MCWPWRCCSLSTSLLPSTALCPALLGQGAVGQGVPCPRALISGQDLQRMRSDIGAQTWGGCHRPGVQLPGPHVVRRGASFPRVGLNIQKTKIMASGPITSWQIDGETVETVSDLIFLGSKITADGDCSHEIKRRLLLGRTQRHPGKFPKVPGRRRGTRGFPAAPRQSPSLGREDPLEEEMATHSSILAW